MNVKQHHQPMPGEQVDQLAQAQALNPDISALVDGEINASELESLLAALDDDGLGSWYACQVIGDVLRGHEDPTGVRSSSDFLAAVRLGIQFDAVSSSSTPQMTAVPAAPFLEKRPNAASNDPVFLWKLLAGFASVAAVMAVSWGVVSGSGSGGAVGAQLASTSPALSTPAATAVAGGTSAANAPVVVNTGQGVLIRDAQLEALLAEHRQHGGMSALQMPSGFIRNATYEAAGR